MHIISTYIVVYIYSINPQSYGPLHGYNHVRYTEVSVIGVVLCEYFKLSCNITALQRNFTVHYIYNATTPNIIIMWINMNFVLSIEINKIYYDLPTCTLNTYYIIIYLLTLRFYVDNRLNITQKSR